MDEPGFPVCVCVWMCILHSQISSTDQKACSRKQPVLLRFIATTHRHSHSSFQSRNKKKNRNVTNSEVGLWLVVSVWQKHAPLFILFFFYSCYTQSICLFVSFTFNSRHCDICNSKWMSQSNEQTTRFNGNANKQVKCGKCNTKQDTNGTIKKWNT